MTRGAENGFQVAFQAPGRSRVRHSAYPLGTWLYVRMTKDNEDLKAACSQNRP